MVCFVNHMEKASLPRDPCFRFLPAPAPCFSFSVPCTLKTEHWSTPDTLLLWDRRSLPRGSPCLPQALPPWLSPRPISKRQLCTSPCLHPVPIYLVFFKGSYQGCFRIPMGYPILGGASRLDAFSVYPSRAWLPCYGADPQQVHQRPVCPGPLVLRTAPLRYPAPAPDRDRTVSRRSEPSSRTALMGEQPNPWDLLQPQDAMSRHRGAKPLRRCELLGVISLLSPG